MHPAMEAWPEMTSATHLAGACAAITVAVSLLGQPDRFCGAGRKLALALACTGLWSLSVAAQGAWGIATQVMLGLRNLSYLLALYHMFASDGRHRQVAQVVPVLASLVLVDVLGPLAHILEMRLDPASMAKDATYRLHILIAMLGVVGSLVLVHNLYASASNSARQILRWPAAGLAVIWGFDLNLYTVAYLAKSWPGELAALHGLAVLAMAGILALGASQRRELLAIRPSRTVTFQSLSLLVIGAYFVAMLGVAQWLALAGGEWARWWEFGFLIVAISGASLMLPSRRLRAWLRVKLSKHLFQHRYDYRQEWLRFVQTIARNGADAAPLEKRAIQAMADMTDSPSGLLLTPDDQGELVLAARWEWGALDVPSPALGGEAAGFLAAQDHIIELDALRHGGSGMKGEGAIVPAWLLEEGRAWALVPLQHFGRLVGVVVLARPPHDRPLDWEDFDLLRVVGQQIATYLAEHQGQTALAEAAQFDEFHRRIAFVMHDIKNLASQFSLLARNAERHAENPAFRADMLVTLRASAERLNHLVARLSRYGGTVERLEPVALPDLAQEVAKAFAPDQVQVVAPKDCLVLGHRHALEQVLRHLLQNGVEASAAQAGVLLSIASEGAQARVEVIDSGHGMSAQFIRNRLFRPFDSTKSGGFGLGAYEARELVRAMQGRMAVESREGLGTRFIIHLPLARMPADSIIEKVA
jgi:putative PEP-CTERM system histidine kinase